MLIIATVPTILYVIGWKFIGLPWQPVAILGTAVAFIVGFKIMPVTTGFGKRGRFMAQ